MSTKIMPFLRSFKRIIHSHEAMITALSIIGLVGLLSVSWFQGNHLISAIDFYMPVNRLRSFFADFYSWDSRSLGSANPRLLAFTFPVWTYFAFSEVLGLSLVNTEKLLFYSIFTISGLSMYYLTVILLSRKTSKFKHLAGLISGLFYMLNPYVAINIMPLRQVSYMIYALLPLIFGLFIKSLNEGRNVRSAIVVAFAMLLATSTYADPSFALLTFLPLFLYVIFFVLINHEKTTLFSAFKFTFIFILTWIMLNLYWLIPNLYSASNQIAKVASAYSSVGVSFKSDVQLNSAHIIGAIRLLGLWSLNSSYNGDPYVLWAPAYQNPLLIVIGFIIPILAFIPALLKPKDKHILFFTCFAIIGLLLVNGTYSPLGNWIYSEVPLFSTFFNSPYLEFGMYVTLAYAFLIGYGLTELFTRLTLHIKKIRSRARPIIAGLPIIFILFLIVGVYAFPLWTGDVIRPSTEFIQSNTYQMPTYYQTASNWLGTDSTDFNIVPLPISALGYAYLKWENGGYEGPYPADWLFPKSVITTTSAGNGLAGLAAQLIVNNSTEAASKILSLMNVKYVLFQEDTNWQYVEGNSQIISSSPEQLQSILNSTAALSLAEIFGKLDFYLNNYWQPIKIYATPAGILADGNLTLLMQIAEMNDFSPSEYVILLSDQLDAQQISVLPINTTFVQSQSLNSTYDTVSNLLNEGGLVYVLDSQPFMAASYYSGWKGVISTNGQGDPSMLIFQSPTSCPYISSFPMNFTSWNAYNSTIIYITTASSPLIINSVQADGNQVSPTAWWETGTSWETGWPIIIPANQRAIIQVNQYANIVSLETDSGTISLGVTDGWTNPPPTTASSETQTTVFTPEAGTYLLSINVATGLGYGNLSAKIDNQTFSIDANSQEQGPVFTYKYIGPINLTAGYHTISTSGENTTIPVYDGLANPVNWTSTFTNQSYSARYYPGWQAVVRTDGSEPSDTMSFSTLDQCPYSFPSNFTGWNAYNSTLVYLTTGNDPLRIDGIVADGEIASDITGVWWETGWMGMGTKPVTYPIIIPANQRAIIQINHKADSVTLETNPPQIGNMLLYSLKSGESFVDASNLLPSSQTNVTSITYEEINPTQYTVHVNASKPFYLVFSETYDDDWVASISGQQIPNQYHFTANGYANGWYINKTGTYTITLEYWPQNLFYIGGAISATAFILCMVYVSKDRFKSIYKKYARSRQKPE